MRSTEASGVGARAVDSHSSAFDWALGPIRILGSISLFTYAIAFVALMTATLYILADAAREFETSRFKASVLGELAAGHPLGVNQFAAHEIPATFEFIPAPAIAGLLQQSAIAYGLAGLITALGFRRRRMQ